MSKRRRRVNLSLNLRLRIGLSRAIRRVADGRRIAIAGIAGIWGTELARRLARDPSVEQIYGIDTRPPDADLERTEMIEVDIRSPVLSRLLPSTGVDTVVHCGIVWYPEPGKPARALHDINVIGTLQLLAACEKTAELERVIVRGSAAIYDAGFTTLISRDLQIDVSVGRRGTGSTPPRSFGAPLISLAATARPPSFNW